MGRTCKKIPGPRRNHMKLNSFTLVVAALIASGPAFAQQSQPQTQPNRPDPTIAQRDQNQQDRIANGVRNGSMSAGQTARVENREQGINEQVHADRQANGGTLTGQEHRQINREQNGASRQIYRDKHNGK